MSATKAELAESREFLLDVVGYETNVYCVLRHVSRSGMKRTIDLFVVRNGGIIRIGFHAARLLGLAWDSNRDGIVVRGAGMHMGFHLVNGLRRALGFATLNHVWV